MRWWVTEWLETLGPIAVISHAFWVIFSICLHELGHGWAAIRYGDRTPIERGHMTWNPLVHMGQMSLLMFALVGIAWGLMPVDPRRMRGRHAEAVVAAAGPAVNLGLTALCVVGGALVVAFVPDDGGPMRQNLWVFFLFGCALNLVLMVLNLIPVPPLDGSRILGHYSRAYRVAAGDPSKQAVFLVVLLAMFLFVGGFLWEFAFSAARGMIQGLAGVLG